MNDSTPAPGYCLQAGQILSSLHYKIVPIGPGKKYPPIQGWQNAATDDATTIAEWLAETNYGIGWAMGSQPNGKNLVCVDIDGEVGLRSITELIHEHGDAERFDLTCQQQTGSGGWHYVFDTGDVVVRNSASQLARGIDIRGEGGQIVCGPTIHPNGQPYRWIKGPKRNPPQMAPEWLMEVLMQAVERSVPLVPSVLPVSSLVRDVPRGTFDGDTPFEWLNSTHDTAAALRRLGWTEERTKGNEQQWTRPGKDPRHGTSATLHLDTGAVNIYSTSLDPIYHAVGMPGRGCVTLKPADLWMVENGITDRSQASSAIRQMMPARGPGVQAPGPSQSPEGSMAPDDDTIDQPPSLAEVIMSRIISTADLAHIQQPDPIVDGWLFRDSLAWIWGPSGSGKSFVAVDMAMHVGTGRDWHGHPVSPGRVLYMIAEGASGMAKRTDAWYEANGVAETDVLWLPTAVNMYSPDSASALAEVVAQLQPALIIIDTLARASVGAEENSAKDAGVLIDNMDRLRVLGGGSCVMMVHHSGKEATLGGRGSSAFKGAMESEIEVSGGLTNLTLKNTKQKNIEQSQNLQFFGEHQLISGSVALRRLGTEAESAVEVTALDIYDCLWRVYDHTNPVSTADWYNEVHDRFGHGRATFNRWRAGIIKDHPDWIDTSARGKFVPLQEPG